VTKLAEEGATVVIGDIDTAKAEAVAAEVSGLAITTDIAEPDQVANLVDTTIKSYGKLDVLVNNAAIVPFTAWDDIDFAEWRRMMRVNLDGTFLMCKAGSDAMRKTEYGRIVNICSNSILAGTPNMAHYEASKGGIMALTRAMATELGGYGITVNSVAPGLIKTEIADDFEIAPGFWDYVTEHIPLGHLGTPQDCVGAVVMLAGDAGAYITGQSIVVDGGILCEQIPRLKFGPPPEA